MKKKIRLLLRRLNFQRSGGAERKDMKHVRNAESRSRFFSSGINIRGNAGIAGFKQLRSFEKSTGSIRSC